MRNRKKDFNKFAKRSSVKERGKARLMAIVNEMNVGTDGAKIKFSTSAAPRSANHTATGDNSPCSLRNLGYTELLEPTEQYKGFLFSVFD